MSESTEIGRAEGPEVAAALRQTLRQVGRRAVVTVTSSSMEPTLRAGDRVTIEGIDPSLLRCGDVVVFESPIAGLIVHRLVWAVPPVGGPQALYTKGDALPHLDRPFAARSVIGRVVAIERDGGRRTLGRAASRARWVAIAASWVLRRGLRGLGVTS